MKKFVLDCGVKKLHLSRRTHVMGILNVTPDSFSDGGRFVDVDAAAARAVQMVKEGADIIDVGGESTRPGAKKIRAAAEIARVVPVIRILRKKLKKTPVSIDTYKGAVARAALKAGADIINDISGLRADPELKRIAAEAGVPVIVMHMKGTPRTMQKNPVYGDVTAEVAASLRRSLNTGIKAGIAPGKLVADPGIGFGKTREHNLRLLARLPELAALDVPLLVGASRKSFIGLTLNVPVEERLTGSIAVAALAAAAGAHIIRAHDVRETVQAVRMADAVNRHPEPFVGVYTERRRSTQDRLRRRTSGDR